MVKTPGIFETKTGLFLTGLSTRTGLPANNPECGMMNSQSQSRVG
jgi:hypothetical protein